MNKKIIIGIIILILIIVGIGVSVIFNNNKNLNTKNTNEIIAQNEVENETSKENVEETKNKNGKTLVVYFSLPETTNANDMTREEENSSIIINGEVLGNTQYVAQLISEKTKADIFRIMAKEDYPLNHEELVDQAKEEQNNDERPEIKEQINNFDEYDVIFIGYPIWWSDMPQIIYTFLESYNFEGKTIIPFSTHGGSGLAGTVNKIKNKLNNATVIENAFTLSRNNIEEAPEKINNWIEDLEY